MSRSDRGVGRHLQLERAEGAVHGGRGRQDRRRAEVEEALAAALADGDRERVSQLRDELAEEGAE